MKKKLIDIYPPHAKQREPADATDDEFVSEEVGDSWSGGGIGFGHKKAGALGLLGIIVFSLFSIHFFFARAQVQVWPQMTKLRIEKTVTAQVGAENVGLARQIVRAETFEQEKVVSGVFEARGQKERRDRARGTIRVYNMQEGSVQTLVANTRFISEGGALFRSQKREVIPASSFLEVEVLAAEPGEEYNIGPSNFSVPGLVGSPLYTKIYGESSAAMTGGAARTVVVVQAEDIAAAKAELVRRGIAEATAALTAGVPREFELLQDSIRSVVFQDDSLVKEGAELDRFNYRVTVRVSAAAFHTGDTDILAKHLAQEYATEHQALHDATLAVSSSAESFQEGSASIPMKLHISVDRYETLDESAFGKRLAGASQEELRELMGERPFLAKAQFSLWPFWLQSVPSREGRVRVELVLDGA